jgi:hypothetical protein
LPALFPRSSRVAIHEVHLGHSGLYIVTPSRSRGRLRSSAHCVSGRLRPPVSRLRASFGTPVSSLGHETLRILSRSTMRSDQAGDLGRRDA